MSKTQLRRSIVTLAGAAALALAAAGCFPWATADCQSHGGLDHVGKIGNSYFAICKDGSWHAE
jgi:hypothetical protein